MLDDNPMRFSGGIHKLTHFIYNIAQIKPYVELEYKPPDNMANFEEKGDTEVSIGLQENIYAL
jgi:hypothetical protein